MMGCRLSDWWPIPRRYYVAMIAFLGFCNIYAMRVNLSVALIDMVRNDTVFDPVTNKTTVHTGEFVRWGSMAQGAILSAFFYGYIFTQLPGGFLARRYGGKLIMGLGVVMTGLLTLLTPIVAPNGKAWLIALRVLEGLCEGVTYPAMHAVWSQWAPPAEKTKLVTLGYSGSYFGTVIAQPLSGLLVESSGWRSVFYFFGFLSVIWSIVWFATISNSPSEDSKISESERDYIENSVGFSIEQTKLDDHTNDDAEVNDVTSDASDSDELLTSKRRRNRQRERITQWNNLKPPWFAIMTSMPVWAISVAHFAENWGFYTMLTELPRYIRSIAPGYSLDKASFLTALPYLLMAVILASGGSLADYLRAKRGLSTVFVRKLFNCGAFLAQMVFIVALAYISDVAAAVVCVTFGVGFGGFAWSGFSVNHLDLAPQYAALLMGISNTIATLPGMISPVIVGALVQNNDLSEWKYVWWIVAVVYLLGAIFYGIFADGERQPWAEMPEGYEPHIDSLAQLESKSGENVNNETSPIWD